MIPIILLGLISMLDLYHQFLVWKCKDLLAKGNCHPEWRALKWREEALLPWTGFARFAYPLLLLWSVEYLVTGNYVWDGWVIVAVINGVLCSYFMLLRYIPRTYKALFVKSSNPHHDRKWLLGCVRNSLGHYFQSEYPRTHATFRLAARLLICNTMGHRWSRWEAVKYGDFGNSRRCKACMVHENDEKGVHTFCETHNRTWRGIVNPNSVFRRKYTQPKY